MTARTSSLAVPPGGHRRSVHERDSLGNSGEARRGWVGADRSSPGPAGGAARRSPPGDPGRSYLLPDLRRGVPPADEHPSARPLDLGGRVQAAVRLQPWPALDVSRASASLRRARREIGTGRADPVPAHPRQARATAERRRADDRAGGGAHPAGGEATRRPPERRPRLAESEGASTAPSEASPKS